MKSRTILTAGVLALTSCVVHAQAVLTERTISFDAALELARTAL